MHVLIIEDEPLIAADIECFLTELGADSIEFAETEQEALSAALGHVPDLITADCNLREGTGPGAVAAIRGTLGEVPVVYVTGNPEQCAALDDMTHAVAKPIRWLELADAVSRHNLPPG